MARHLHWATHAPWFARHPPGGQGKARPGDDDAEKGDAGKDPVEEEIDEAGRESFPASDPPAWTLGIEPNPHNERKA